MKAKKSIKGFIGCALAFTLLLPNTAYGASHPYTDKVIKKVMGKIYETTKVELAGMKVLNPSGEPLNVDLVFTIFDTTIQEFLPQVVSKNGVLDTATLIQGHQYILSLVDANYEMKNRYFTMHAAGELPTDDKNKNTTFDSITVQKREQFLTREELKKVNRVPFGASDNSNGRFISEVEGTVNKPMMNDFNANDYENVTFKLVNQYETVNLTIDKDGVLQGDMLEDVNYAVVMESTDPSLKDYIVLQNLVTAKNHEERGDKVPARTYTHYTCNPVEGIYIADSQYEGGKKIIDDSTYAPLKSFSKQSTLEGIRAFITGGRKINTDMPGALFKVFRDEYVFNERILEETDSKMVIDFDTINMHRDEISKLPYGNYTITTTLPDTKEVQSVYQIDRNGKKVEDCNFTQEGNSLTLKTTTMSLYNTVIEFKNVHVFEKISSTAPTCTETGMKEHWKCSTCGKLFLDSEGLQEVTVEDLVLPLEPHKYENGKCVVCGEKDPESSAPVVPDKEEPPINPDNEQNDTTTQGNGQNNTTKPENNQETIPHTGDTTSFVTWMAISFAAVIVIIGAFIEKRKYKLI